MTKGLLAELATGLDTRVPPEDLFAYCYAVLSAPAYARHFAEELEVPGPRMPLTRDPELFAHAVELGGRLIWLHTYGARFVPDGHRAGQIPRGRARCLTPVGTRPDEYPASHAYDEEREELHVGAGVFAPVAPEVRRYSVSGLDVVGSWLDYRMRRGAGRQSSALDRIRPEVWTAAFTEELLHLLWVVEHTVALAPVLNATLERIVAGPTFGESELPPPAPEERLPPTD